MNLLATLLPASNVLLDVAADDKRTLFDQVAGVLHDRTGIKRNLIFDSLLARERMGSTGLGHGIAIPHGRVKGLREATGCFVRTREPIPFDAPDDAPVRLLFVLLVPEKSTDLHLEILSELAQMFSDRDVRTALGSAPDAVSAQRLIAGWQPNAASH